MTCACESVTSSPSGACCFLGASVPSGQYVHWHVSEEANPAILVPAYQLGNVTETVLSAAATQRFWVSFIQVSADTQAGELKLYWTIGGGPAVQHSHIFRGTTIAHGLRTYSGPAFPLPKSAELYVLSDVSTTVTVNGYGLLETL